MFCSVPPGDEKTPAASSQKRKRTSSASPVAAPAIAAPDRVDNVDILNIKPIHFNVPPILEIPRFGDPNLAERISTPHWDGQPSLGSLEGRLLAQNEAVWNRVRILNEQVGVFDLPDPGYLCHKFFDVPNVLHLYNLA